MLQGMEDVQYARRSAKMHRSFFPNPTSPVGDNRHRRSVVDRKSLAPTSPTRTESLALLNGCESYANVRLRQLAFIPVAGVGSFAAVPFREDADTHFSPAVLRIYACSIGRKLDMALGLSEFVVLFPVLVTPSRDASASLVANRTDRLMRSLQTAEFLQDMFRGGKRPTASRQTQEPLRLSGSRAVDAQTAVGRVEPFKTMVAREVASSYDDAAGGCQNIAFVLAFVSSSIAAVAVTSRR